MAAQEAIELKGEPLGVAAGLAVRFIFFHQPNLTPPGEHVSLIRKIEHQRVTLSDLARTISTNGLAERLYSPIGSFYRDITLTEESARRLPVVVMCAVPNGLRIKGDSANFSPRLKVRFPGVVWSQWEGEWVDTQIVAGDRPKEPEPHSQFVGPLEIDCDFADCMAFFETGHIAYCFSLIFHAGSFAGRSGRGEGVPIYPGVIISLLDLARTADGVAVEHPDIGLAFAHEPGSFVSLPDFVSRRLRSLAFNEEKYRPAGAPRHHVDPHTVVREEFAQAGAIDVFQAIIRPTLKEKHWTDEHLAAARDDFLQYDYGDLHSATCEIVEFDQFDKVVSYVQAAKDYKAQADDFGEGLSGLAQNVIDYVDQDSHEVSDSLISAGEAGGYLHFIHSKSIVRIYKRSRSFQRTKNFIGGDPYFFFTVVTAAYNEHLTNKASHALSQLKPGALGEAMPFFTLFRPGSTLGVIEVTRHELVSRYDVFARCIRPMIPNLFRYTTEHALFEDIHAKRGISLRRQAIEHELSRYEGIARDFENLNLQTNSLLIGLAVFILAVWQVFGVVVTVASFFVIWHADRELAGLHREQIATLIYWSAAASMFFLCLSIFMSVLILAPFFRRRAREAASAERP